MTRHARLTCLGSAIWPIVPLADLAEGPLYYLGVEVRPLPDLDFELPPGWTSCVWPDGKRWKHWSPQLKVTPWGKDGA